MIVYIARLVAVVTIQALSLLMLSAFVYLQLRIKVVSGLVQYCVSWCQHLV